MKNKWDEIAQGWNEESIQRVDQALERYTLPPPSAADRQSALEAALKEMGKQHQGPWLSLWQQIKTEARFLPLWYYLASAAIALTGIILLLCNREQAMQIGLLAGFTPLPMLLGLMELFHGADEGMAEIEAACRYSPARVISARMAVIGTLSCGIGVLFGACSRFGSAWMSMGLVIIPYSISAAFGMFLSAALQGKATAAQVALTIALVNSAAAMLLSAQQYLFFRAVTPIVWIFCMIFSIAILLLALRRLLSSCGKLYERSLLPWN